MIDEKVLQEIVNNLLEENETLHKSILYLNKQIDDLKEQLEKQNEEGHQLQLFDEDDDEESKLSNWVRNHRFDNAE